jgi:hypothetical protein
MFVPIHRQLMLLFLFSLPKSVAYDVKVKSKAEMETMSTKMTSTFSDSQTFTKEMQQTMTTNNVESVSPTTITADTSATPTEAGTLGGKDNAVSNDDTTKPIPDEINVGVIVAAVLVPLLVIAAVVGGFVWYRTQKETKLEKHVTEMVNPVHTGTMQKTPVQQTEWHLYEIDKNNQLSQEVQKVQEVEWHQYNIDENNQIIQEVQTPQEPTFEVYVDNQTGRRYSVNNATQQSKW